MKEIDLRIGNIYKSVKWEKPVILTAEDIYELVIRAEGASIESYISEIFEPIELTKEILIDHLDFKYDIDLKMILIKSGLTCNVDNMEFCYSGQKLKKIKYVHEIQSLYYDLIKDKLKFNEKI